MSGWLRENLAVAVISASETRARLEQVAQGDGFTVVGSRSGHPVLEWHGRALDSRRDPVAAARSAAGGISVAPVVVIGLGTGYFADALLERGIEVVAIVDTADALSAALASRDLRHVLSRVPVVAVDVPGARGLLAGLRARTDQVAVHTPRTQMHQGLAELAQTWATLLPARPPRVVVAGPSSGGSLGVARSVAAAARALGANVQFVDASVFGAAYDAFGRMPVERSQQLALQGHFALLMGEAIVEVARAWSADLVLALAQAPLSVPALSRLRYLGIKTAFWFVENTRVLPYWRDVARHYDACFAIQTGQALEQMAAAGATVTYLPMACDPASHFRVTLDDNDRKRFGAPVAFAGAPYLNRRHVLGAVRDLGLRVWGDGWESTALAGCVGEAGRFDAATLRKVVSATAVNLNVHSAEHVAGLDPQPDYVNPRTFEIAACGGFQLVDRRDPLPALFEADEVATFESAAHMRDGVVRYLEDRDAASEMAAKARARALDQHTYEHRVRELLERTLPAHLQGTPRSVRLQLDKSIDDSIAEAGERPTLDVEEALLRLVSAVGREAIAR